MSFCRKKCCKKGGDDGEWFEPLKPKKSSRRAAVNWEKLRDHVLDDRRPKSQPSVRWADVIENLHLLRDDDGRGEEAAAAREDSEGTAAESGSSSRKKGSRVSLAMGSSFEDDSIGRGLGGFARDDDAGDEGDGNDYKHEDSDMPKSSDAGGGKAKRNDLDMSDIGDASLFSSTMSTESTVSTISTRSSARKTVTSLKKRMTELSSAKLDIQDLYDSPPTPGFGEDSFKEKRMTLLKFQSEVGVNVNSMRSLLKRRSTMKSNARRSSYDNPKLLAVTSIAVLGDRHFLAASRSGGRGTSRCFIKMYRAKDEGEGGGVEFVRGFEGHKSGITALATLDCKGRFLSAGMDKTVRLWDSRFNVEEDPEGAAEGIPQHKPIILLATFDCFERLIYSIQTLTEGSYCRPTDNIDTATVVAMAKKTAFEGAASVQQAAIQREIIECSGSFATLSRNDKKINMWEMTVADKSGEDASDENCAQIKLVHHLEHDASIGAMTGRNNIMIAGDIMGVVVMWKRARRASIVSWGKGGNNWTKIHKFTPWKPGSLTAPAEISKQSILKLCLLDNGTFVSGSKNGTIRVWDGIDAAKEFEVHKKRHAHSMKVTGELISGIRRLPPVNDPNTGEGCLAFSVGSTDGHVMSMALYPRGPGERRGERRGDRLVMFHVYGNSPEDDDNGGDDSEGVATAVESIAVSGTVSRPVVVAGDCEGGIKTLSPTWKSVAIC